MKTLFINTEADMEWLKKTHLIQAIGYEINHFKSALLYGPEDAPYMIDLYLSAEPVICDSPFRLMLDEETDTYKVGKYHTKASQETRLQQSLQNGSPNAKPL